MALTTTDYLQQLQALLPNGPAWPRESESLNTKLLTAFSEEFSRIDFRIDDLLNEADPRSTSELLADWERVAGLPDICVTEEQTVSQRRVALVSKLTMQGGQSKAYFIEIANSLGYPGATIEEYSTFNCGESGCGDALWTEEDRFCWQINLPSDGAISFFSVGESVCGEPLQAWGDEAIECRINKYKPAHTTPVFAYV